MFTIDALKPQGNGIYTGDLAESIADAGEFLARVRALRAAGYDVHVHWEHRDDDAEITAKLTEMGVIVRE